MSEIVKFLSDGDPIKVKWSPQYLNSPSLVPAHIQPFLSTHIFAIELDVSPLDAVKWRKWKGCCIGAALECNGSIRYNKDII